jgi:hypothetical protein
LIRARRPIEVLIWVLVVGVFAVLVQLDGKHLAYALKTARQLDDQVREYVRRYADRLFERMTCGSNRTGGRKQEPAEATAQEQVRA